MQVNKKAIETYFILILVISVVFALLLTLTINLIFSPDNEQCKDVTFEIIDICKLRNMYKVEIQNTYSSTLKFNINGKTERDYVLSEGDQKVFRVSIEEKDEKKIIPILIDDSGISYTCRGKTEFFNDVVSNC